MARGEAGPGSPEEGGERRATGALTVSAPSPWKTQRGSLDILTLSAGLRATLVKLRPRSWRETKRPVERAFLWPRGEQVNRACGLGSLGVGNLRGSTSSSGSPAWTPRGAPAT